MDDAPVEVVVGEIVELPDGSVVIGAPTAVAIVVTPEEKE